jgi:anti-sigma factor RsiW
MRLPFRRQSEPISCKELVEIVTDYIEGTMSAGDRRRFDEHIENCHWCRRYVEQMEITIRTVGRIEEDSIEPRMRAELLAAFSDWNAGAQPLP